MPAGDRASGGEVAELLERVRAEEPDARIWKGVREIEAVQGGARVQFHEGLEPRHLGQRRRGRVPPLRRRGDAARGGIHVESHIDGHHSKGEYRVVHRRPIRGSWTLLSAKRSCRATWTTRGASRLSPSGGRRAVRVVIPFTAPLKELEQEPTAREIEVLQLISEGLVNREIGHLFLSEETQSPTCDTCLPSCRRGHAPTRSLWASGAT